MEPSFADRMSSVPAFAICFLALHLAATAMGYGAALLLLPDKLKRDALAFAPVFGFCVLAFGGWHFMFLGPPGTNRSWPWLLLSGLAISAAGVVLQRRRLRETLDRDVAWLALFAAAGVCFVASPMTRQPHLTTISKLNNDPAHYSAVERLLQERRGDAVGPEDTFGLLTLARDTVTGAYLATAALSSATGVPVWRLQQPCVAVFASWDAWLAGLLALRLLRFRRPGAILVTLFAGLASLTLFTAWNGYKAQFAGMAPALALFLVLVPVLEGGGGPRERWLAPVPAALALALGLALAYPHMLPLVWAVLGAVAAAHALRLRSWAQLGRATLLLAGVLAGLAALSPGRARVVVGYTRALAEIPQAGWYVPWTTPQAFLGLSGDGDFTGAPPRDWVDALAALAFAGLLAWGVRRALATDRPALATAAGLFLSVLAGYVALCIMGQEGGRLGGYKPYKLLAFFYPAVLPAALLAFRELRLSLASWGQRAALGAAAALSIGMVLQSAADIRHMRGTPLVVTPEMAGLQRLEGDARFESINIVTPEWWELMWQTAFLINKRLYEKDSSYYPKSKRLDGKWTLLKVSEPDQVLGAGEEQQVPVSGPYVLIETSRWLSLEYGEGWHPAEPGWRRTSAQRATVAVFAPTARPAGLELRYKPLAPGTTFSVLRDGETVGRCSGPESCSVGPFDLPAGTHTLAIESSASDPGALETAFTSIQVVAQGSPDPR